MHKPPVLVLLLLQSQCVVQALVAPTALLSPTATRFACKRPVLLALATESPPSPRGLGPRSRASAAIPKGDALDATIAKTAVPSIANLAVIPLVGAVDTFFIGRMGNALALAGQGAANQARRRHPLNDDSILLLLRVCWQRNSGHRDRGRTNPCTHTFRSSSPCTSSSPLSRP